MARSFTAGDYIEVASDAAYDNGTLSFAGWMKTSQSANFLGLVSRHTSASRSGFTLFINSADDKLRIQVGSAGASSDAYDLTGTTAIRTGAWFHVGFAISQTSGQSGAIYVNGSSENSGNAGTNWTFNSEVIRWARLSDAFWTSFSGSMAEWAWWSTKLTTPDFAMLAAGYSPQLIKPASLVDYWPIIGKNSPENTLKSARTGTLSGTAADAHPRVIYPKHRQPFSVTAAAGGFKPFWAVQNNAVVGVGIH